MLLKQQVFSYKGKVLIERALITPPFTHEALFQNEGCFIHLKEARFSLVSAEGTLQLNSKDAVLLKCGAHFVNLLEETGDHPVEFIAFHLYPEILQRIYHDEIPSIIGENGPQGGSHQLISNETLVSKFVDSLGFYFDHPAIVNDDLLELKIKELILLLIQTKNAASIYDLIADLFYPKKIQLKQVIDAHLYTNLRLEQLAKLSNLSLSSFKREFKKTFGDTPSNYITKLRMEKAKELLILSDLSVSEIAYDTGFNDPLYFTRLFKKREGITPSHFRRTYSK